MRSPELVGGNVPALTPVDLIAARGRTFELNAVALHRGSPRRLNTTMSWPTRISCGALLLAACALNAAAHGNHMEQIVVAPDADWATRHMAGTLHAV